MTAAIELRDIFRVHSTPEGDAASLQGLSLSVRERELLVVLGPSGSGKSSLLRILAGLDRPSAGKVSVLGLDLPKLPAGELARFRSEQLGYVDGHHTRALAAELPVRELVGVQLGLAGAPRRERDARADELLERVGLLDRAGAHPTELSGGEQQRVAVCAALAHRPRLFLADEPTGELDAGNAERLYALIGELARDAGCTAVIVSHDPASAELADRFVRIRDGRVSDEVVRGDGGRAQIVVGRGGWLQLPEELVRRAGIGERAVARLEDGAIVVERAGEEAGPAAEPVQLSAPGAGVPTIVGRGIFKGFGGEPVLRGLDLILESGRLYALTGPSGSGKTTLLHLLAGLDLPDAGEISLLGTPLAGLDRGALAALRRAHVGFVGQGTGLSPTLSARENVELALALRGIEGEQALERAVETLDAVGLTERREQRVGRLSTGERLRVAIARAIAGRPALLLADEPTSRLDRANALAVGLLLGRLCREQGTTVLCSTHDPVVVEQADAEISLA
ncbi:MAG: ABC transporter ATP-binding protein [Gaiellaceae bacterium]